MFRAPTGDRQALWLTLLIFSLLIAVFAGTNNIFVLFLLDKPFDWEKVGYISDVMSILVFLQERGIYSPTYSSTHFCLMIENCTIMNSFQS